jgi:hypothetical protein
VVDQAGQQLDDVVVIDQSAGQRHERSHYPLFAVPSDLGHRAHPFTGLRFLFGEV